MITETSSRRNTDHIITVKELSGPVLTSKVSFSMENIILFGAEIQDKKIKDKCYCWDPKAK